MTMNRQRFLNILLQEERTTNVFKRMAHHHCMERTGANRSRSEERINDRTTITGEVTGMPVRPKTHRTPTTRFSLGHEYSRRTSDINEPTEFGDIGMKTVEHVKLCAGKLAPHYPRFATEFGTVSTTVILT